MDALLADLRSEEGWKPFPYDDSRGFLTIGYGFLIDAIKGGGLPKPVAAFWLQYLVNETLDELRKAWPPFEDQPTEVQRAVANLAYQLGVPGLLKFKRMLAALAAGDRATAAEELLDSTLAKQTPDRTKRTAALIRGVKA